jgi:hypothetical protein
MESLIAASSLSDEFPFELRLFGEIQADNELERAGCEVLGRYLDSSPSSVYFFLHLPATILGIAAILQTPPSPMPVFCLMSCLPYFAKPLDFYPANRPKRKRGFLRCQC